MTIPDDEKRLANDPRLHQALLALLPVALLLGVLAGLRWPQRYTLSYWLLDYHDGFGKRGLIGSALWLIDHPPYHYLTLTWMIFIVMAAWLGLLLWLAWRPARTDTGIALATMIFLLSAGFASLVRDAGRGEHFGFLLALPCLTMPLSWPFVALRAGLLAVAVLIHDANLVIVAPLVAFDVFLAARAHGVWRAAVLAALCAAPACGLALYVGSMHTGCDLHEEIAYYSRMAADFRFEPGPAETLCMNAADNLQLTWHGLWQDEAQYRRVPPMLLAVIPGALVTV